MFDNSTVAIWVTLALGILLSFIVLAFVFSPRFRRDLLSGKNQTVDLKNENVSGQVKGAMGSLVVLFLAALVFVVYLQTRSPTDLIEEQNKKLADLGLQMQTLTAGSLNNDEAKSLIDLSQETAMGAVDLVEGTLRDAHAQVKAATDQGISANSCSIRAGRGLAYLVTALAALEQVRTSIRNVDAPLR